MTASPNRQPADDNGNALVLPAWGDEFDLTDFFLRLEPGRFGFRDSADLPWAKDTFKMIQGLILRWVALYRGLVRSANVHPEAMSKAVMCLRRMGDMDWSAYCSWFTAPDKDFEEITPHHWFMRNGLEELGTLLGSEKTGSSVLQKPISGNVFKSDPVVRSSTVPGFCPGEYNAVIKGVLAQLKEAANAELEPPFNLRPLLDRWQPQNRQFISAPDGLLASEVFMVLEAESLGWLKLYHCALETARQRSGIMRQVLRCLQQLQAFGVGSYVKWFRSPQAEFGGISPESFFVGHGYVKLAVLLVGT